MPISARLVVNQASLKTRSARLEPLLARLAAAVAGPEAGGVEAGGAVAAGALAGAALTSGGPGARA
jgi:hypothetical protein